MKSGIRWFVKVMDLIAVFALGLAGTGAFIVFGGMALAAALVPPALALTWLGHTMPIWLACLLLALLSAAAASRGFRPETTAQDRVNRWFGAIALVGLLTAFPGVFWLQLAVGIVVMGGVVWVYRDFIHHFGRFLADHLVQAGLLVIVLLIVWGLVGSTWGLPELVWSHEALTRLFAAMSAVLVVGLIGIIAFYLDPDHDATQIRVDSFHHQNKVELPFGGWTEPVGGPKDLGRFLRVARAPFLILLVLPALLPTLFPYVPRLSCRPDWIPKEAFPTGRADVARDPLAYVVSVTVWCLGLGLGVVLIKLLLKASVALGPLTDEFTKGLVGMFNGLAALLTRLRERLGRWIGERWRDVTSNWYAWLGRRGPREVKLVGEPATRNAPHYHGLISFLVVFSIVYILLSEVFFDLVVRVPVPVVSATGPIRIISSLVLFIVSATLIRGFWVRGRPLAGLISGGSLLGIAYSLGASKLAWLTIERLTLFEGVSPVGALFAMLGLVSMTAALVSLFVPRDLRPLAAVGIIVLVAYANRYSFKYQYENLSYDESSRVQLNDQLRRAYLPETVARLASSLDTYEKLEAKARLRAQFERERLSSLVGNHEALSKWREVAREASRLQVCQKPILVVVAASGGGARAAMWSAVVLDQLGREIPGFHDSTRLVTGSSGGAVGIAHYLKWRYDLQPSSRTPDSSKLKTRDRDPRTREVRDWLDQIPQDSLSSVARATALRELWRIFSVGRSSLLRDRGRILEENWPHLRQIPLVELRPAERAGVIPSFLFAPFLVEDGRRLIITNLDLLRAGAESVVSSTPPTSLTDSLATARGFGLVADPDEWTARQVQRRARATQLVEQFGITAFQGADELDLIQRDGESRDSTYSIHGLEFFKLFDRADGFRLSSAARMESSVPPISPGVYLPSNPPVRPVDSGYADREAVNLATAWLRQNREWIVQNTAGVVLVQIRSTTGLSSRIGAPRRPTGVWPWLSSGFQFLTSVPEGGFSAVMNRSVYRNADEVAELAEFFQETVALQEPRPLEPNSPPFFTTAVFEQTATAAFHPPNWRGPLQPGPATADDWNAEMSPVSWIISPNEIDNLKDSIDDGLIAIGDWNTPANRSDVLKTLDAIQRKMLDASSDTAAAALAWEMQRLANAAALMELKGWWSRRLRSSGETRP